MMCCPQTQPVMLLFYSAGRTECRMEWGRDLVSADQRIHRALNCPRVLWQNGHKTKSAAALIPLQHIWSTRRGGGDKLVAAQVVFNTADTELRHFIRFELAYSVCCCDLLAILLLDQQSYYRFNCVSACEPCNCMCKKKKKRRESVESRVLHLRSHEAMWLCLCFYSVTVDTGTDGGAVP